jgi:amino acid transporter
MLERKISTTGILLAAVSATIGSGWLFGSLFAAQMAGPAAILSWIVGGIAVIFVALCYAEIITMFPISGSVGAVSYLTHGSFVSFSLNLLSWLAFIAIVPIEVQAVIQYSTNMLPFLMEKVGDEFHLTAYGYLAAAFLTGILMLINAIGTKFMSQTNSFFTIWKLAVPVLVIFLFLFSKPHLSNLTSAQFAPNGVHGLLATLSIGGIVLAFNGFQPAIALAGETKNPQKSLPIALIGSILICMVIYCLLQFSFVLAVPVESISKGWANLNFNGDAGPFAGLAIILGFSWLAVLLYTDAIISPLACGLVFLAASARSSYAMSKNRQLPAFFQKTTNKGVPLASLGVSYLIAMSIFFFFHSWQTMSAFYAAAICLCNAAVPIALIIMRKDFPDFPRPYKLFLYKPMSIAAFYISNLMLYWCGFSVIWKLDFVLAFGFCFFGLFSFFKKENFFSYKDAIGSIWFFAYLFSITLISYFGSFGGKNIIPFGFDFLLIFGISIVCLCLAHTFKTKHQTLEPAAIPLP